MKTVKIDVGIQKMSDTYFTFKLHPLSKKKLTIGKEYPSRLSIALDGNLKLKDLSNEIKAMVIKILTGREDLTPSFKVWKYSK